MLSPVRREIQADGRIRLWAPIPEAAGRRYWGDVEPYVYVGDAEIHHFICTNCGNLTAIQFKEAA